MSKAVPAVVGQVPPQPQPQLPPFLQLQLLKPFEFPQPPPQYQTILVLSDTKQLLPQVALLLPPFHIVIVNTHFQVIVSHQETTPPQPQAPPQPIDQVPPQPQPPTNK